MWRGFTAYWRCRQDACSLLGSLVQEFVRPSQDPEKMARIAASVKTALRERAAADTGLLRGEVQTE